MPEIQHHPPILRKRLLALHAFSSDLGFSLWLLYEQSIFDCVTSPPIGVSAIFLLPRRILPLASSGPHSFQRRARSFYRIPYPAFREITGFLSVAVVRKTHGGRLQPNINYCLRSTRCDKRLLLGPPQLSSEDSPLPL